MLLVAPPSFGANTFPSSGNVGIGDTSPWTDLVVSSGNSGDSIVAIEADLDNNNENDNPRIEMRMDGGLTGVIFGFAEEAGGTANVVRLATMYGGTITWDTLTINPQNKNVGIGTTNPTQKLAVNGSIRAKEVIVDTGWSDFVFEEGYHLPSLDAVRNHIKIHGHLPGVPSAAEIHEQGLPVGESQKILMQKVEELTLYLLQLKQANEELQARIVGLEARLATESTSNE